MPFELVTRTIIEGRNLDEKVDRLKIVLEDQTVVYCKPRSYDSIRVDWDLTDHKILAQGSEDLRAYLNARDETKLSQAVFEETVLRAGVRVYIRGYDRTLSVGESLSACVAIYRDEEPFPIMGNIVSIEPITVEEVLAKREQPQGFESWPDISA